MLLAGITPLVTCLLKCFEHAQAPTYTHIYKDLSLQGYTEYMRGGGGMGA